ncbi:MAG: Uma2 family endonuclease [Alphaproteobacteria bacterium]|nr:Uma2 family endonuclease [Alphaproteobacteria bacterium]MBV9863642.1 Uma2 family endonuclease [Alphaproteobacteria bacterium]
MSALPKLAPSSMTLADFMDWPGDGSGLRHELVDGEIRAMAPASITHGIIQANLARLLGNHLRGSGCMVVVAPGVIPRVRASFNMRVPDLAVTCAPNQPAQGALPDPILVIEILWPSNESETRENVWAYATIPTLREILLIRSTEIAAELLRRAPDGTWPGSPETLVAPDALVLDSVDFRCPLAEFYAETHLAG